MTQRLDITRLAGLMDDRRGLTAAEVEKRRRSYGYNDIIEVPSSGWRDVLRDTLGDPMVWFLGATALLFAWLGDYTETLVLTLALIPILGMDAYLHRRTQASTQGLAGRLAPRTHVVRDGLEADIPSRELVPGDLAIVASGQPFPADGLIVAGDNLQADESMLTGESLPAGKCPFAPAVVPTDELHIDASHWAAAGTRLLTGTAALRIARIGAETLYGQIVRSAQRGQRERTPLQQAIAGLVAVLLVASVAICSTLAVIRFAQGHGVADAILSAITLAVAALPEEFPVVFTFFLGVGVYRLARRQALVRRAVVVENIGRVTCICSDKTGTLTEGRLSLSHHLPAAGISDEELLRAAAMASRADSSDPVDVALLSPGATREGELLAVFPFTADRRREVAIARDPSGVVVAAAKGAPETVLTMSSLTADDAQHWLDATAKLASTGHKVIACAILRLETWFGGEPDRGYRFLGLLAFEDRPRDGVAGAVAKCRAAGIRVIMVTGDHAGTAAAVASAVGIGDSNPLVVEGPDLAAWLERSGPRAVDTLDVVARASPSQKLDLVRALQRRGEIVAVTGDGVNDVPALQAADIGVAMGERGTRTAREVASIVLLDDNFRTIVRAIAEGAQLFRGLKLSFAYLLIVHLPLVISAAVVPFAGLPLLYLPVHVVWLELIIHPTALFAFQRRDGADRIARATRSAHLRFFERREWLLIALVSTIITIAVLLGYWRSLGTAHQVEHARTMALIMLMASSATVTAGLAGLRNRPAISAILATIASAIVLVQLAPLATLLHLQPLHADDWLLASLVGLAAGALATLFPIIERQQSLALADVA